jgi:hypothetical protein
MLSTVSTTDRSQIRGPTGGRNDDTMSDCPDSSTSFSPHGDAAVYYRPVHSVSGAGAFFPDPVGAALLVS